jgi:hypothetical protein
VKSVKDFRKLLPVGLDVQNIGHGRHGLMVIVIETGEVLRTETGLPLCVSGSPSDWRSRCNELARIRRAFDARLHEHVNGALKEVK